MIGYLKKKCCSSKKRKQKTQSEEEAERKRISLNKKITAKLEETKNRIARANDLLKELDKHESSI